MRKTTKADTESFFYNSLNFLLESGYGGLSELKSKFGSWEKAWEKIGAGTKTDPERDWGKLEARGIKLILRENADFPQMLAEIPCPPFGIYVLGEFPWEFTGLAIIGTRKATNEGKSLAQKFSEKLAARGITIVSGLALGIDAAAHEGCLGAKGKTIAVLGCGLDRMYPRTNEKLAGKIVKSGGAVISEYPPGAPPLPYRFLERNRIISGLSRGILVVEAPKASGALRTARYALDQNRDVFVVPGPISYPNYAGSNQLIRKGAELVTRPEEILEAWEMESSYAAAENTKFDSEAEQVIFELLRGSAKPLNANAVAEISEMEVSEINKTLALLVIKGAVKEAGGTYAVGE